MACKRRTDERGFTLIEILMVIMLVGIVSAVAIPQFIDFGTDARIQVTKTKLNELRMAIIGDPRVVAEGQFLSPGFLNQVGSLPNSLVELTTQGAYPAYNPFSKRGWRGPYISTAEASWDRDAWGTVFQYDRAGRTIRSCGRDKVCGNADDVTVAF